VFQEDSHSHSLRRLVNKIKSVCHHNRSYPNFSEWTWLSSGFHSQGDTSLYVKLRTKLHVINEKQLWRLDREAKSKGFFRGGKNKVIQRVSGRLQGVGYGQEDQEYYLHLKEHFGSLNIKKQVSNTRGLEG
jgi:hypothetical protein